MIAFYSSQQRSLYIEDIYRVLSLPQNFVIQFRYPESIVEKDIRRNIHSIINQDSIIFYTVKESNGELKNIPIRNAKIKDVYISEELEYINFYLELGNFVDCEVSLQMNSLAKCPPQIFVSQLNITQSVSQKWLDTIVKVAPYFEELKFIYIKSFKNSKNGTVQKFKYNPFHKRSFLNLNDEQEYTIEILSYDKTKGNNEISIGKDEKTIQRSR